MAWFPNRKIGFQKSELKGHVVAFSKQAERYTAIFQFPHHATGSPNSQVSFCKHHLPLKKYVLHQQNWDPGTHEGTTNPYFRHSSAAADSSREIDLLAKTTLLLHDLNLFLLRFLRWRLWHLRSRVALHAMCLRSLGGLAWHVWVPQAAFILSLLLVFGSRLCAPLAQWIERAEPWLLRFFDALVNRDLVFLEEPGRPQENRSSIRCLFLVVIMIEWQTDH